MADKLSETQLTIVHSWIGELKPGQPPELAEDMHRLMKQLVNLTAQQPGSLAVMRASSAVPILRERRLIANRDLTNIISTLLESIFPNVCSDKIWTKSRISIEFGYTAIELALEEELSHRDKIVSEAAHSLVAIWKPLIPELKKPTSRTETSC